jgi:hypothetical protein
LIALPNNAQCSRYGTNSYEAPEVTGRELLTGMFTHTAHRRGQAEMYLRIKSNQTSPIPFLGRTPALQTALRFRSLGSPGEYNTRTAAVR